MGRKYAWRALCVLLAASGCAGTGQWPRHSPWDRNSVIEASQRRPPADPFPQQNGFGAGLTRVFPGLSRNPEFTPVGNPFGDASSVEMPRALARRAGSTHTAALTDEEYRIDDELETPQPERRRLTRSAQRLAAGPRRIEPDDESVVRAQGDPPDDPAEGATVRRMPRLPVPIVVEVDPESVPNARNALARPDRVRTPEMPGSISTGSAPMRSARASNLRGSAASGSDLPPIAEGAIANGNSSYPPSVRRTGRPLSVDSEMRSRPRATLAQTPGSRVAEAGGTAIVVSPEFAEAAPPLDQGPPAEEAELRQAQRPNSEPANTPAADREMKSQAAPTTPTSPTGKPLEAPGPVAQTHVADAPVAATSPTSSGTGSPAASRPAVPAVEAVDPVASITATPVSIDAAGASLTLPDDRGKATSANEAVPSGPSVPKPASPSPLSVGTAGFTAESPEPAPTATPSPSTEALDASLPVPAVRLPEPAGPVPDAGADSTYAPAAASETPADVETQAAPAAIPRPEATEAAVSVIPSEDPAMAVAPAGSSTPAADTESAVPSSIGGVPADPFAGMVVPTAPGSPAAREPVESGSKDESKPAPDATPAARDTRHRPQAEAPKGRPRMPLVRAWRDGLSAELPPVQFPAGYYESAREAASSSSDGHAASVDAKAADRGTALAGGPPRPRRGWGLGLIRRWRDRWEENHPPAEAAASKPPADETMRR